LVLIKNAHAESSVLVDLTPVIDMVFLLLIFFLVATTFHQTEREMQIALPEAAAAGPISMALREIVINIDAEGNIIVGGDQRSAEDLRTIGSDAIAGNPNQKVTVRGDKNASYGMIAVVLDICKGAGIQEPSLDTVPLR